MSIKSVHITNYYHKDSGGISTAYNKLLEAANRHERYVRLIVPGEETTVEDIGEYGRIYYIKAGHSPLIDRRYRLMMPWKTYMPDGSPIKTILRREKPDVIEIGEKYTLSLMAGLLRKRLMNVTPHRPMLIQSSCERMDDNVRSFFGNNSLFRWFSLKYMGYYNVPMYDFHVTNSEYTKQELIDAARDKKRPQYSPRLMNTFWKLWRSPMVDLKDRVFVNHCGVDTDMFSAERRSKKGRKKIFQENGFPLDARILLYAGRISPEKNASLLPATLAALRQRSNKDFRLLIAGAGPSSADLVTHADAIAPGAVKVLGQITNKGSLADLYANCDAFIHPNPREPFGIAPLEAMASGLPVVVPNAGGVLSYADRTNTWLAEPTAKAFADAVINIFDDKEHRAEKIEKAFLTSQQFSWERSTDSLFALYDKTYSAFNSHPEMYDYVKAPLGIDYST